MTVNEIMNMAIAKGACSESGKASDWKSLAWLLFTPQGREFCAEHRFPSIETWRGIKDSMTGELPVRIDSGTIFEENPKDIAIIGDTCADIAYRGANVKHNLIVMHGAKVRVYVKEWAVLHIVRIGSGCEVEVINDGTGVIV